MQGIGYLVRIDLSFVIISVMTALWLTDIIAVNLGAVDMKVRYV